MTELRKRDWSVWYIGSLSYNRPVATVLQPFDSSSRTACWMCCSRGSILEPRARKIPLELEAEGAVSIACAVGWPLALICELEGEERVIVILGVAKGKAEGFRRVMDKEMGWS